MKNDPHAGTRDGSESGVDSPPRGVGKRERRGAADASAAVQPGGPARSGRVRSSASASAYPASVNELIDQLAKLPGIGRRSAERLAFHILKSPKDDALALGRAVADVKQFVRPCSVCYNLTDWSGEAGRSGVAATGDAGVRDGALDALCSVCGDDRRERSLVMVVEQPKDLIALEQTGAYKGLYHVLMGRISPLEGVGAGDLTIGDLLRRVDEPVSNAGGVPVTEIVLALNPTLEGDGTGLYLADALSKRRVRVTRLARGLPAGSPLEFANKAVLSEAILERRAMD